MSSKKKFKQADVIILSFGHMMHDIYSAFLAPLIPLLVNKLGISLSLAGSLDIIRNVPTVFNPLLGLVADRISVRYFVILAPGLTAIVMSLLGTSPTFAIAVIMMLLAGISAALFHVPAPVIIKSFSGDKTGTGMSYYMFGGELSRTLGPLIVTAAITIWGLEGTWRLIPFGVAASLLLFIRLKDYQRPDVNSNPGKTVSVREASRGHGRLFMTIAGYTIFMMATKVSVTLYLPAYIVSQGKSLMSGSFSLAVLQFFGAAGVFFAGIISDRIGKRMTLLISGLACPIIMWLYMVTGDSFAIPLLAALGFFLFANGPVILALVQDSGTAFPSFANGLYMTINYIIRSLMVILVGHFAETVSFDLTYRVAAIWGIGVLPFIFLMPEKKRNYSKIV